MKTLVVQLGPGLKSKTKALDRSRTLNSLWIHHHHPPTHPPTENLLQGSRLLLRPLSLSVSVSQSLSLNLIVSQSQSLVISTLIQRLTQAEHFKT